MKTKLSAWVVLLSIWGVCGCTSLRQVRTLDIAGRPRDCACLLKQLNKDIIQNKVANAGAARVNGFPYLRTDRLLSAIAKTDTTEQQFLDLLDLMRKKADLALKKEIRNLPFPVVERLADLAQIQPNQHTLTKKILECNKIVFSHDIKLEGYRETVAGTVHVPTEYSCFMRAAGLYPIASLPVAYLTYKAHQKFKSWFDTPESELPVLGS